MVKLTLKIFGLAGFWGLFFYTVFQVPYPESLTSANIYQLFSFFIPLFLGLTMLFFLKFNIFQSGSLALGIVIVLILKSFDSLNLATLALTFVATFLLFSYFKNLKLFPSKTKRLKLSSKRPTLTHKL